MSDEEPSKNDLVPIDEVIDFVGSLIDWIWAKPWPKDDRSKAYCDFFMALSKEQRAIWATWRVQAEVANGGFGDYFTNAPGDCFISEALKGFRELGAEDLAVMFQSVLDYFDSHREQVTTARTWKEYAEVMGFVPIETNLNGVTRRFLDRMNEFYRQRREYILSHLDAFGDDE